MCVGALGWAGSGVRVPEKGDNARPRSAFDANSMSHAPVILKPSGQVLSPHSPLGQGGARSAGRPSPETDRSLREGERGKHGLLD